MLKDDRRLFGGKGANVGKTVVIISGLRNQKNNHITYKTNTKRSNEKGVFQSEPNKCAKTENAIIPKEKKQTEQDVFGQSSSKINVKVHSLELKKICKNAKREKMKFFLYNIFIEYM